jgi:hypothetical protein
VVFLVLGFVQFLFGFTGMVAFKSCLLYHFCVFFLWQLVLGQFLSDLTQVHGHWSLAPLHIPFHHWNPRTTVVLVAISLFSLSFCHGKEFDFAAAVDQTCYCYALYHVTVTSTVTVVSALLFPQETQSQPRDDPAILPVGHPPLWVDMQWHFG